MKINVDNTKVLRMSREPSTVQCVVDQKQLENVKYFNCFGSMKTSDARCTRETKSRNAMAQAAFNRKKILFTSRLELNFKEESSEVLHFEHSIVWC